MENVAAEREMDRRSVEQKQQMGWGAAERGAGTQPLLWLLSLGSVVCLTCSVCPPARLDAVLTRVGVLRFSSLRHTLLSPSLKRYPLIHISSPPSSASSSPHLPIVLTSVGRILQPPEWGCYPDVDQLSSLLTQPRCGGTYHHVVRRCGGTYHNTRRHHYRHTRCTMMA